ncbi:hypothetical protein DFH09DRAFT_1372525 [Mycena vulgaris]|nr:hypothetical protein DFH09DRAFT_1372525 [Mycena vulgaris]
MQAGGRMGVPAHLAPDRAAAEVRWVAGGGTGPQPIGPTAEDIHEKNARPVVRFERQLVGWVPPPPAMTMAMTTTSPSDSYVGCVDCAFLPRLARRDAYHCCCADGSRSGTGTRRGRGTNIQRRAAPRLRSSFRRSAAPRTRTLTPIPTLMRKGVKEGGSRWAAHAWRARLCVGYGALIRSFLCYVVICSVLLLLLFRRRSESEDTTDEDRAGTGTGSGKGGAAPGRIGRVYELGSFSGLWAGDYVGRPPSILLPCILEDRPSRALRRRQRQGFVGVGVASWSPAAFFFLLSANAFLVVGSLLPPSPSLPPMPSEPPYSALIAAPGGAFPRDGLVSDEFVAVARPIYMRISEHHSFYPHTPVPPPPPDSTTGEEGMRAGLAPARHARRPRRRRHRRAARRLPHLRSRGSMRGSARLGYGDGGGVGRGTGRRGEDEGHSSLEASSSQERASASSGGSSTLSSLSASAFAPASSASASASASASQEQEQWPEWDAPAWAGHRFADDEGWEDACDGVQDVVFTGATDPRHGMAWHHYEYAGRVRPWDGLIGLVMRPRDRTMELATYFISGHIVGRDTFEGTWQMAAQDVLAPSWGGSVCLARGEE